jgi:hypothetical protein
VKATGQVFRALASSSGATLGWPLEPAARNLSGRASPENPTPECYQLSASPPSWYACLEYDEFQALPCKAISPYGCFARGLTKRITSGVVLFQEGSPRSLLQHAAYKGFPGLRDTDLRPLLKELGLQSVGRPSCTYYYAEVHEAC